ncbi:acyl carrier protein [Cohnella sp. GCM10027633]|uniref:acyl carrier protein n=1 Tax=unclassified Cohnella TaxID=2636738 RepID=UPI00363F588F
MIASDRARIVEALIVRVAELVDDPELKDKLQPDSTMEEAGIDSILFLNLILYAESAFEVAFRDDELSGIRVGTLSQLADRIHGKRTVTSR